MLKGSSEGHHRVIRGASGGCQGDVKVSPGEPEEAVPSRLHATSDTAGSLSDTPHQSSSKQEMPCRNLQDQHPREASHALLGLETSSCGSDVAHIHRQPKHSTPSLSPQDQRSPQLKVTSEHSSGSELSFESGADSASSISSMTDGCRGGSRVGGVKAGTSARSQFPQQPDSVGSIAQLFMMRMRARLVLQVCTTLEILSSMLLCLTMICAGVAYALLCILL